ncbi:ecdysteroid-regulated 16 kDa protein-like [Maniola jurtina]|uniref:ecdysteroid-regulated 16 kDa protein-like n=1 Tax=Maniola jurtina TaxID=191418 RepID=UPI001E68C862|nr:ecdysteroid-regulated 16 kDa protein-like [Maniola jurtina]XP_045776176.1 ecdysteroid-regulated 16 kDa protein-like [Maniola jurtina]
MNKLYITVVVLLTVAFITVQCNKTPSEQCSGQNFEDLTDRIQVLPCGKSRCKLRKGTNTTVIFKFKPKTEVKKLTNDVYAVIAGLPLPFIGVSGVSACAQVKRADTGEPAPCPLAPNQEYLYTNHFPIESFYPAVPLRVHWSLNDGVKDVICFEVPAVIA